MKPKLLVTLIIIAVFVPVFYILPGIWFGNSALDINMHDTYIVMPVPVLRWLGLLAFLPLLLLLVFAGRCVVDRFRSRVENCVLLALLFINEVMCVWLIKVFSGGFTLYPPLSQLPQQRMPEVSVFDTPILSTLQIILTLLLVIVAIITGRNWKEGKQEASIKKQDI
jgi:hypothetical protein